jgi:ketosteroid isomerase-like protein
MQNDDSAGGKLCEGGLGARFRDALVAAYGPGREGALEGLLALYDEDLQFRDPVQELRGRDAFAKMNRQFLGSVRSVEVSVRDLVEGEASFFMAWTMRVAGRIGPAVTVQGVTHARTRGGKIVEQRDYFDLAGSVLGALPGVSAAYRFVVKKFV